LPIANTKIRYGVNRINILLWRESWKDNKNVFLVSTRRKALT
jgi:hypothetical protein